VFSGARKYAFAQVVGGMSVKRRAEADKTWKDDRAAPISYTPGFGMPKQGWGMSSADAAAIKP